MKHKNKKSVLVFTNYYLPGFKGGGPIRTISNMVNVLGDEIDFSLVTLDRDLGADASYLNVQSNTWQQIEKATVYYSSPSGNFRKTFGIIRAFKGDAVHLNSFFSFHFSILPLILCSLLKPNLPIILGPRGEFSEGALRLKAIKKKVFIAMIKMLGLYRNVIWHASTEHEARDIHRVVGADASIRIALDITSPHQSLTLARRQIASPLRIVFLSRISPKKNLLGALQVLCQVRDQVVLDVYGPAEDIDYWATCQTAAKRLPPNVQFSYCGELNPEQVPETLSRYDLFYLPTMGENFGHVIAEALGAGLPVLISDQTPWRDLATKRLGWDLPLADPGAFAARIDECCRLPADDYDSWRRDIRAWALHYIDNDDAREQHRQLFMNVEAT